MELHICEDNKDLSQKVAAWMVDYITSVLQKRARFTLVLSGGSTPQALNILLAGPEYKSLIDWSRLHIFWGDERYVPFTDKRNNAKMAFDTLLSHVSVPPEQIHRIDTDLSPEASAAAYEKIVREYFPDAASHGFSFDLVLLGMGDDGHTLSLFPGTGVMHEENKLVTSLFLKEQDMYRVTLTAPIVNRSARIAFLVSGADKARALKEVIEGDYQPDLYPSQVIDPQKGELHWFVDRDAAAQLH